MSEATSNVSLSGVYQDAAGHWHAHFAWQSESSTRKGEAVYDSSLQRVILGEQAEHWPDAAIREVKRALRAAFEQRAQASDP